MCNIKDMGKRATEVAFPRNVKTAQHIGAIMNAALTQVSTQEYKDAKEKTAKAYRILFKLSVKLDNFIWDNIHDRSGGLESLKQCNEHIETALCILDEYDV
jgi:hypothetical protein